MATDTMDGLVSFPQFSNSPPLNLASSPPSLLVAGAQLHERADGRPSSSSTVQGHHKRQQSQGDQGGRRGKKRKLSQATNHGQSQDDGQEEQDDGTGDANAGSPPRKQRACDQCKQQKLKCNLIEDPYKPCDRCKKFNHECKITDDFKRIAKRTQLADLERSYELVTRQRDEALAKVAELSRMAGLSGYHGMALSENESSGYPSLLPSGQSGGGTPSPAILGTGVPHEHTEQAQLLLQLKQGQMTAQQMRQGQGLPRFKRLRDFTLREEVESSCWTNFFTIYHKFLPILDETQTDTEGLYDRSKFLFWTIMLIALRHWTTDLDSEQNFFLQLLPYYSDLVRDTITKPPKNHLTIKALCLLCYWPLPVSGTTEDMTFTYSGIMMKHAMQIGLHRPSHPDDFARARIQLKPEDVQDRLRTWVCCNIVAQNVSTGYGQPPDTVYDATLNKPIHLNEDQLGITPAFKARLEIEKIANQITKTIYLPQNHPKSHLKDTPVGPQVDIMAQNIQNLETTIDISDPLDILFLTAIHLHLRLHVFFADPTTPSYQTDLNELYVSATSFLDACFNCGYPLSHAPNYIMQMMFAAAVALLKLLNSSFAAYTTDREAGEKRFWDAITWIREMSVRNNDLPQRLGEVFAQMWKADAERFENSQFSTLASSSNGKLENGADGATVADLKLKRKSRMSMSHVYDSIWRWREEVDGKVRAEKLETAIKNPTSPQASTHRGSFGSTRRPSETMFIEAQLQNNANVPGLIPFEGLGEFEIFDPLSWALDLNGFGMGTGTTPEPAAIGWS